MKGFRSREVTAASKPKSCPKTLENVVLEPATPSNSLETSTHPLGGNITPISSSSVSPSVTPRRSMRLASKTGLDQAVEQLPIVNGSDNIGNCEEIIELVNKGKGKRRASLEVQGEGNIKFLSLRSGKKVSKRVAEESSVSKCEGVEYVCDDKLSKEKLSEGLSNSDVPDGAMSNELGTSSDEPSSVKRRRFSREEKGKGTLTKQDFSVVHSVKLEQDLSVTHSVKLESEVKLEISLEHTVPQSACFPETLDQADQDGDLKTRRRLSREEKGKNVMAGDSLPHDADTLEKKLEHDTGSIAIHLSEDRTFQDGEQDADTNMSVASTKRGHRERFRDIAKRNASRFAHFSSQAEEEMDVTNEATAYIPREEAATKEVEDWPGPFSTAMKIIRDREMNIKHQQQSSHSEKSKIELLWVPKKAEQRQSRKLVVPSLQDLCMTFLVKNADALASLDFVPDALRHRICQSLCDSRRMTSKFFELLAHGSPTEIRITDCSWSNEEEFTRSFEGCDTSNLVVLQLDQCGRCMPDYILLSTLARCPNNLPALTTLSLKGACRLSDAGLTAIISAAPCLRSINLSQCSLLTSDGISCLSNSLGSVLRELFLDDCESIDPMLILPALLKLEHLEVLSVAGIQIVCDAFINEFVNLRGQSLREIVLKGCLELTDCSLKEIAQNCPGLRAIDLSNLSKLTDSAIGYLASGCRAVDKLKFCRNAFSDEAVAAYVETSGESLKELSLNCVSKVSHNTAMSLAKCSNLISLDLSWCRNFTNEALGLIVDNCSSLEVLKLFGCTQVTSVFLDGHSNTHVQIIGLKMTPMLKHIEAPDSLQQGPLRYSAVP